MVEVKDLCKNYGAKQAVRNISFTVRDGEVLGFLGPNGAGKSTTMKIITGYTSASSGTVTIDGHEIFAEPAKCKAKLGYLPEQPPLYQDMTVLEYLRFMFELKKVNLPMGKHLDSVCRQVGVADVQTRAIRNLSKGYRQRVGLAQALLGEPDVIILDEPTVGLDPKQIIDIRNLIKALGKKHTVILSSHILPEVQATCERVVVIDHGKIIADGTPDALSHSMRENSRVVARIDGPENRVLRVLGAMDSVESLEKLGRHEDKTFDYALKAKPGKDVRRELFTRLSENHWPLLGLRTSEMSLEEIFLQLTAGGGIGADEEGGG